MNKKKLLGVLCILCFAVFLNIYILQASNQKTGDYVVLHTVVQSNQENEYQVYYGDTNWLEENSVKAVYSETETDQVLTFSMPCDLTSLRFDLGNAVANHKISQMYISYKDKTWDIDLTGILKTWKDPEKSNQIESILKIDEGIQIQTNGTDGYVLLDLPPINDSVVEMRRSSLRIRYGLVCALVDVFFLILLLRFNRCYELVKELYKDRKLILNLSKNDFKTKYAGSFFGMFWAFVQPIITILIYWFVFSVGFRTPTVSNCPFVLFLTAGMVPWFFFSEAWNGATNSLLEYSYLVKKVVFKISTLPIVKVLSAIFVSLFFHGFMCVIFILHGYTPNWYWLQLIYYLGCIFLLALSLSYITCSIIPFFRDLSQIMNIILQVGVWMTPIMWNIEILPISFRWLMKINPIYYVVQGYRNTLISGKWFWQDITWTIYFWAVVGVLFVAGNLLFKRMRPHFADVI